MTDHDHPDCAFCTRRKLERDFMEASGLTVPAPKTDPALWDDRPETLARDNHVEEQVALGRDIYAGEWDDTDE